VSHPIDELILENNNLPSLPGHVFASLRVLRLMLRNNRLERVSSGWLEGLHDSLLELFLVEPDLRSLPADSLENLQGLEAVTLQSKLIKRLPSFAGASLDLNETWSAGSFKIDVFLSYRRSLDSLWAT
jgi:Leucine-rich repeat (LRR) protein